MKNKIIYIIAALIIFTQSSCVQLNKFQTEITGTFDTIVTVIGFTKSQSEFLEAAEYVHQRLITLNNYFDIYHTYDGINNLKTINDNAGYMPVVVDPVIIDLLKLSIEAYEITDGKMNIALGAVLKIWHEYRENGISNPENAQIPPIELLMEANQHTDIGNIVIDEQLNTVFITDSNTSIDVGSIAKGYAAEIIAKELDALGHRNFILNLGGNIRSLHHPNDYWTIGIQNPELHVQHMENYFDSIKVNNLSVVTSGSYQRFYSVNGINYNHIIDPDTLMPANLYQQVTVIYEDSAMADILSTALFIMDFETGYQFIQTFEAAEAIWVFNNGEIQYTEGYAALSGSHFKGKLF